ncbi:F-box only protein 15 isoform X1 [Phycodurus eques]|uniref:F-box only protein 15 isoform X1 n=1 Tax=Phycodurus eques TaxID=693459 RepID=UPI002ACED5C5|nr:F-box only protein 15 isoform X1 [Phycodurus eques]
MLALKATKSQRANKPSRASLQNFTERLPYEIQNKILSYLDAGTLLCISQVSKIFYQLANDVALWRNIFKRLLNKKPMRMVGEMLEKTTLEAQDQPSGYWKLRYFKTLDAWNRRKWKTHIGVISRHTGLPSRTVQMLRNITWELTVMDKSKNEATYDLSWLQFFESSAVLCWDGSLWPDFHQISTVQLHGVRRVALNCPGLKAPGWRSLMDVVDMESLTKTMQDCGRDQLVELKLLKHDVVMGLWKERHSVAFVMFTLHFCRLLERSTQGSSLCPYVEPVVKAPFDDIDPDYGLHGYQLNIVLHSTECEIMSASFSQLFCRRDQICDGHVRLTAVNDTCFSQHTPLSGNVTLPWRCEALRGEVKDRCIMTLTLLDEFNKPFWCVSTPVVMKHLEMPCSLFYSAEHFLMHYRDSEGQVLMKFVRMEQQKQFFLINLAVYVTTCKVNKYFRKQY